RGCREHDWRVSTALRGSSCLDGARRFWTPHVLRANGHRSLHVERAAARGALETVYVALSASHRVATPQPVSHRLCGGASRASAKGARLQLLPERSATDPPETRFIGDDARLPNRWMQ